MVYSGICEFCGQKYILDESSACKSVNGNFFISCKRISTMSKDRIYPNFCNGYVALYPNFEYIIYKQPTISVHA